MPRAAPRPIYARRLKEARTHAGLSQRQLGVAAGIDLAVAAPRISRYEAGLSEPSVNILSHLARALGVPMAYFYAEDDQLAWLILSFDRLGNKARAALVRQLAGAGPGRAGI